MNDRLPQKASGRRGLVVVLVAALVLVTQGASASGIPVVDGVHLGISKFAWVEQYRQMLDELQKQKEQLQTQMKQYDQMKLKMAAFSSQTSFREDIDSTFPERGVNEGAAEKCGAAAPTGGANIDARKQQYTLCVRIVQTENRRFNMMRKVLENIRTKDAEIQALIAERNSLGDDEFGRLGVIDYDIKVIEAQIQADLQAKATTLEAYNTFLLGLREENQRVAAVVLRGESGRGDTLVGQIVSHGTLKLALQAARQRDR
ncbi:MULTISPECIES: flagellar cap protein FliD N-terminal domain-containing protein [unclassified Luteimonas]